MVEFSLATTAFNIILVATTIVIFDVGKLNPDKYKGRHIVATLGSTQEENPSDTLFRERTWVLIW